MIRRDKMFLIAGNIDDSIKSQSTIYDIKLFKTFVDFERYVDATPVIINTLVLTTNELQFTNTNMVRLLNILNSPFMEIRGSVIYLVDNTYDLQTIHQFLTSKGITDWAVYQGDLSSKFISDIVNGEGRETVEGQVDIVTYRIRASEYIKQQQNLKYASEEDKYMTDEDLLQGVPDEEEPEDIKPTIDRDAMVNYIVGDNSKERTLMAFLLAQYRSLRDKTVIVEKDCDYHTLTEFVTKSGVDCELITVDELLEDITRSISIIRETSKTLIVIGAIKRVGYDYNFIMDILQSNLKHEVAYFIQECDYDETPYGRLYSIVVPNNVPDVLKCCNSLKYDINPDDATFIGIQLGTLGPVNITSDEMKAIITKVLGKNNIVAQVVKVSGIVLQNEEVIYDILGILNRADR